MKPGSVGRWALVTLTCAVLAAAVVTGFDVGTDMCPMGICPNTPFAGVRMQRAAAARHQADAWNDYRDAATMALATRVLPARATAGEPFIWIAPDVPSAARRALVATLTAEQASYGVRTGQAPVAVLVTVDTASVLRGVARPPGMAIPGQSTRAIWPSSGTNGWCVSVVTLGHAAVLRTNIPFARQPLFDACGFYFAFGTPQPALASLLAQGWYRAARAYRPSLPASLRREMAGGIGLDGDPSAYRCGLGLDRGCAAYGAALIASRPTTLAYEVADAGIDSMVRMAVRADGRRTSPSLLDRVATDLGTDRFREFWTDSSISIDATLASIGRDAADASWRMYRAGNPFGMDPPAPTLAVIRDSVLLLLAVIALAVAAARFGRRPSVTS